MVDMAELNEVTRSIFDRAMVKALAEARRIYPNLDGMPPEQMIECVSDTLDTPLGKMLKRNKARREHELAYPATDKDIPNG